MPRSKTWAISTAGGSDKSSLEERIKIYDGFGTPEIAIQELILREKFNNYIWEPAAGEFDIVKILRPKFSVFTSDIYRWHSQLQAQQDFLTSTNLPYGQRCDIISNPPFSLGQEFVAKAMEVLQFGSKLALLLRVQFLEGITRKRILWDKYPPIRVWVFSYRIPRMHRFNYHGKKTTSVMCFAWFVWIKGYQGKTEIKWI
jgi:hypothetical protein